jgi:Leucine-rich repeat (LRR) protein
LFPHSAYQLVLQAQREQAKRREVTNIQVVSEQQDAAQNQAQVELYVKRRLEAPDKDRFGGPDNHYLLDNLEIAFALQSAIFTHTFKHTKEIPRIIGQLEYLQELNLGYNDLISVPTEITELHQLRRLILCENKLVMLPMLGTLQNLVVRRSSVFALLSSQCMMN